MWTNWRQLQWPSREGMAVLIRLVQSRLGRRQILGLFREVIALAWASWVRERRRQGACC